MNSTVFHLYIIVACISTVAFSICAYYCIKPWYKKQYSDKNTSPIYNDQVDTNNSINSYYSIK